MLTRRTTRVAALAAATTAAVTMLLPGADADLLERLDGATSSIEDAFAPQLVTVTADLAQRNVLAGSGLDLTEHAGRDYVEVVLHTPADLALLQSLGLPFDIRIPDLLQRQAQVRELDEAYAASITTSALPSGRTGYRDLADYEADMRMLAAEHPDIVRLIELPNQTVEGKTVLGIEIASDVEADDGRPTMAIMGVHHAREWPSGENTIEFAFALVEGHGTDERITSLLDRGRVVVVPVVNADGFEKSIRDGMLVDLRAINEFDPLGGTASVLATPGNAYKRKNCRIAPGVDGVPGVCDLAVSPGGFGIGVDLNRNYGTFHGGPGASNNPADPTYHGPAGFSEPETQNIRELVSNRQVTMLITNHTFGNLVLRPNGVNPATIGPDGLPVGDAPDEDAMRELGARMTAQNGYANQHGWELYDTTGTTEDWSYNATGGYGYTFEIGPNEFHPPYAEVVDEFLGTGAFAGRGNRAAYLEALETAVDPTHHSVLRGEATPGATLRLERKGSMPTWTGSFEDFVSTSFQVPASGAIDWHVNPSTRPIVEGKQLAARSSTPAGSKVNTLAAPGTPDPAGLGLEGSTVDVVWNVPEDSAVGVVDLDWDDREMGGDLDLELFRVQADGSLTSIATSGNMAGEAESITFDDVQAGQYVARVTNYLSAASEMTVTVARYASTTTSTSGLVETWTLSCLVDGDLVEQVPVIVDRGQLAIVDLDVCGPVEPEGGRPTGKGTAPGQTKKG